MWRTTKMELQLALDSAAMGQLRASTIWVHMAPICPLPVALQQELGVQVMQG
jgi:hypothetical protein